MARKKKPLLKRHAALQSTMDRFRHRAFDWQTGATCIHLLRHHLKAMGYKVPAIPKLDGPIAARRELKKRGWASVEAMLDELLEPIPVAAMLPGDVSVLPSDDGLGGVLISLGSSCIGYADGTDSMVIFTEPGRVIEKAWRV